MKESFDKFFVPSSCHRCGSEKAKLMFTMSWFTTEKICFDCADKEDKIKKTLREKGIMDAMEGCGFIPFSKEVN